MAAPLQSTDRGTGPGSAPTHLAPSPAGSAKDTKHTSHHHQDLTDNTMHKEGWVGAVLSLLGIIPWHYSTYCPLSTHNMVYTLYQLTTCKANHVLAPHDTLWRPYLVQVTSRSPQSCHQFREHVVACTVEFSLQPLSPVLCQLNLHA